MIEGKNISKDFVSRKIFLLLAIAVILILLGIHFRTKSSSAISVKDAEKQIEENLRAAGVSEYEKIDLQAYEKQADKLVKQLKKYQKDYEYVTFESNIHGDLRKTDVERIRKFFETGT